MSNYQTPPQPVANPLPSTQPVATALPGTGNTFWCFELEIGMSVGHRGEEYSLSEVEILLDALAFYRNHQLAELQEDMQAYATDGRFSREEICNAMTKGDLIQKLDQIKVLNTNLEIMTSQVGVKLREISRMIQQGQTRYS